MYNTWTAGPLPVGASWIENASGYAYATRTYQEARELAARWNATAHGREWYQPFRGRRDG